MNGRGRRQKGHSAEREVAKLLSEHLGVEDIRRNLEQTARGGMDLVGLAGCAIEVKRAEQKKLAPWWKQTYEQAQRRDLIPVLVYRGNYESWKFVVPLAHLMNYVLRQDKVEFTATLTIEGFAAWYRVVVRE